MGLTEALNRVGRFVKSNAAKPDLQTLTDIRNGIVHAAGDAEIEERVLTAFVQQAETLLADLGRERGDFWDGQLGVVDALLKDASDKLAHLVEVRLAAATAMLERRYATEGEAVMQALRTLSKSQPLADNQHFRACPVCDCHGIASGWHDVHWEADDWDPDTGEATNVDGEVWFIAERFHCRVCNLRLDSESQIEQGRLDTLWQIEGANPLEYMPQDDDDAGYERWREDHTAY